MAKVKRKQSIRPTMKEWPVSIKIPAGFTLDGKGRYWIKDDFFYGSICLRNDDSGARLCVSGRVPLAPVRRWVKQSIDSGRIEVGWNPFKAISDGLGSASKWLGDTVKSAASSSVVQRITSIVNNPMFKQGADALTNILPGWAQSTAQGLLRKATGGSRRLRKSAQGKIRNITSQAQSGNPNAAMLWQYLSTMYRGGQQPQMPWGGLRMPQQQMQPQTMTPQRLQLMQQMQGMRPQQQMMSPQQMQQMQMMRQQMRMRQQQMQMMPQQRQMQMPGIVWPQPQVKGEHGAAVEGWLFNIPYRSNLEALSMDMQNPRNILRYAYHKGVNMKPEKVSWPNW